MKWIAVTLLALSGKALALDGAWISKEEKNLEQILKKSGIPDSQLGIYIAGGEGEPKVILAKNPDKKMIPASITKLVTAATSISQFPPGTKFKTSLWSSAAIEDGVLKGDLILKGGGDPSFVSETMWFLVNAFIRSGVKTIEGNILVDDTYFDQLRFDPSRQKERVDRAYDAPTGAMSFNWNSVNVFVRPGKKAGDPALVFADPENQYIQLKSKVTTLAADGKTNVMVDRDEDSKGAGDVIVVSGKIALNSKEVVVYKNITQPDLWAGSNLKSFLQQRGVEVKGSIKSGKTPESAKLMAEAESKTIEGILADMNKFSNNYVAEMLTKNLAAATSPPGTIEKGMKVLNRYLLEIGVPGTHFELFNPSGLTRQNKMTATAIWKVLNDMKFQFRYQPEFVASLPIGGVDGTLKNRMKDGPGQRWVRAKTGLLDGVVALAGYAGRSDGTVLPFVFMYNGNADGAQVRSLFDRLAVSLVE
ncbi:MAG: D-alanyl-D-alanine carboxypeptidase/D-alanyl-D-alanine-endopeptidase [Pseudobdellovibrionaceae bacterium]